MKKLLTKFTSIFLAVVVLMSCCLAVPVSADFTSELINEFPAFSFSDYIKIQKYKYYFCIRISDNEYYFYAFYDDSIDTVDIVKLCPDNGNILCQDSDGNVINNHMLWCQYTISGNSWYVNDYFATRNIQGALPGGGLSKFSSYGDNIYGFVNNVIWSSFDIFYDGIQIYDCSTDNKFMKIGDMEFDAGVEDDEPLGPQPIAPQPGDYDFVGPLPLIPIEGDPTYQGFKDWLIDNKKYEELAQFGVSCTASNISAVVDLWTGNYNSINGFLSGLKSMWSTINAVSQAKNIYNWFEQQWQLYKKSLITYETIPIKDNNVLNYDTDYDEDGNFISSETAYLKLILNLMK